MGFLASAMASDNLVPNVCAGIFNLFKSLGRNCEVTGGNIEG